MYIFSVNFWIPILYTAYRFGDMEIGMIVFIYHDSIFGDAIRTSMCRMERRYYVIRRIADVSPAISGKHPEYQNS